MYVYIYIYIYMYLVHGGVRGLSRPQMLPIIIRDRRLSITIFV